FPISPVCGSCEAQSTISALDDSSKYTRQASQFVTLTTSPISSFSIFFKDMSELTIPLTRCNKASCDRAESGEFTSVALIGFSPPPEPPRLCKRIASSADTHKCNENKGKTRSSRKSAQQRGYSFVASLRRALHLRRSVYGFRCL